MQKISWCESKFRQFNADGTIHRGEINPNDVGLFQINTYYHLETAKKMNIDIFTPEGNLDYAEYLFEKEGSRPWNSSKGCWGREIAQK